MDKEPEILYSKLPVGSRNHGDSLCPKCGNKSLLMNRGGTSGDVECYLCKWSGSNVGILCPDLMDEGKAVAKFRSDDQCAYKWVLKEAVVLCKAIEALCPEYGCHVALTGGVLYKEGLRKDVDLLFYRIRQVEKIDIEGLLAELRETLGIEQYVTPRTIKHLLTLPAEELSHVNDWMWCQKARWNGKEIDFFFPEAHGEEYAEP